MPTAIQTDNAAIMGLHEAGKSSYQIAAILGNIDPKTIQRRLKHLTPRKTTQIYRELRADILAEKQRSILMQSRTDDPKKARDWATAYGIYYDKERIERGQVSQIIGHGLALSAPLQDAVDRIVGRLEPVDNPGYPPVSVPDTPNTGVS